MNFKQSKPTVVILCGLPGAGKTTFAKQLEKDRQLIRFCPDEWIKGLGVDPFDEDFRPKLENLLWRLAQEVLKRGQSVVMEYGFWARVERDEKLRDARALGVNIELHYLDVPLDELTRRFIARGSYIDHVMKDEMKRYAKIFQAPTKAELGQYNWGVIHKDGKQITV